ncbi:MAG: (d)CMP kinase [Saprospiraceae bacterium]
MCKIQNYADAAKLYPEYLLLTNILHYYTVVSDCIVLYLYAETNCIVKDTTHKIIIAIDGFSSCGKSTLAKDVAQHLGYGYIDTGAMYRAVTLYFMRHQVDLTNTETVLRALEAINIHFERIENNNRTFLNDEDVEGFIRTPEVSANVSQVAAISEVRRAMVKQQQAMGKRRGIVMDGRDIGTVVFTDAELKIFLTADKSIRAQRRLDELAAKGYNISKKEVLHNLEERDRIDSTREDSPLRKAVDAIEIDNTHLSREAQTKQVLELALQAISGQQLGAVTTQKQSFQVE